MTLVPLVARDMYTMLGRPKIDLIAHMNRTYNLSNETTNPNIGQVQYLGRMIVNWIKDQQWS